jgi:hypothetical protein
MKTLNKIILLFALSIGAFASFAALSAVLQTPNISIVYKTLMVSGLGILSIVFSALFFIFLTKK